MVNEFKRPGMDPSRFTQIYNVVLTNANQEYSQLLPQNTRKLSIQCRKPPVDVKYSTVQGESGTVYQTLNAGVEKWVEDIHLVDTTIYLQTDDTGSPMVEIEVWYT